MRYSDPKSTATSLMRCFPGSFINSNLELIVHRESNEYFLLADCITGEDIVAKSLEWLSRAAAFEEIEQFMDKVRLRYRTRKALIILLEEVKKKRK